jgi:glycosyltransferase involved in cell wall biosynthesis
MPTHNRCQLLQRAVKSVLKQSYPNIELIIIDDGSTDDTQAYLTELITEHNHIQFFTQPSAKGACAARNIAINVAKGELITGLDDDDEFQPERIKHLVESYDDKFAFTCTGFLWHYGNRARAVDNTNKIITLDEQLSYNYATNQVLVATYRLREIGGFDEDFVACQDYDTWTRLIKRFGDANRVAGASYIIHRGDDIERLTKPTNWLKGHSQYLAKHSSTMDRKNIMNQEFVRIVASRSHLSFFQFYQQVKMGLVKQKVRYFLSSNFAFLTTLRRKFLEKQ